MLCGAARTRSGTRDVGAWLFTALLRSVGVEARLVCSLQPLQFGFQNEGSRQQFISDPSDQTLGSTQSPGKTSREISSKDAPVELPETLNARNTRNPSFPSSSIRPSGIYDNPTQYIMQNKSFSPFHPYFWTEAWDVASQKWISVEPMISARVNQPSRIEPPNTAAAWETGAMGDNILSYAVGFDNSIFSHPCPVITSRWVCKGCYSKVCKSLLCEDVAESN